MRQTLSRGVVAAAAATGILTLCGSSALADTQANGVAEGSPGVLAGNNVEVPVEVPVNACGNTVDPVGALNPAFANACAQAAAARHATRGSDDLGDAWGRDHHDWTHGVPRVPADTPESQDQSGGGHDASGSKDQGGGHDTSASQDQGGGGRDTSGGGEPGHGADDASTSPTQGGGHATSGGDEGYGSDDTPKGPGKEYGDSGNDSGYGSDDTPKSPGKGYGDSGYGSDDSGYGSTGGGHTPPDEDCEETPPGGGDHTPPPGGGDHTPPPGGGDHTPPPGGGETTPPGGGDHTPPGGPQEQPPTLPHTGAEGLLAASGFSAALITSGALLYRRGRAASRR
ncbi:chaplin family protein [Streptomyces longwoodensis]|uniref:chaplin family protein n=1 Tax=Streptomyces longwoodensis TaxID=68231 RepID=UPI003806648F